MCLILTAWHAHPAYALVVAANRDEFYDRPAAPLAWWSDAPNVLGGRDLAQVVGHAGTWMGMTRDGRFAALTNYRAPSERRPDARSRGELVADFLTADDVSIPAYLDNLTARNRAYNGYNLLTATRDELWWTSNRAEAPRKLSPGLYGLSNALLDTPWFKVRHRMAAFAEALAADTGRHGNAMDVGRYLALLSETREAPASALPSTGVAPEWEKLLSAAFIRSPRYGTRASTVVRIRHDGCFDVTERRFDAQGQIGEARYLGVLDTVTHADT
ncbi:hypothetical protein LMG18102_04314 [Ralstonia mannitolilytica]|uniref:NRDE family protein n=1 Tax=Ralstonia mannitolilytica TaxID=105219 RepID=UPI0028F57890|nr:NRDE family protein [Ralstonia mannitolilytica]CAJ0704809.1 hypothetical protein LMG18102_04314 [Ralstonia mannitolilytica]